MLSFRDVSLLRGGRMLCTGLTFTIHAGQKVGITGANGVGKSSLFALVRGELAPEGGAIELPTGLTLAHVAQETPPDTRPALEYALDGDQELREIEAAIVAAEEADDGVRLGELHAHLGVIDGYAARARAARLLHGLGFTPGEELQPVATFSGGWRMRLNLSRALICRSDLLLLDEPTNHLDLDAVIWLEEWLLSYQGTLLLISHDRDFLDRVVGVIAHMERGGIKLYTGNYSEFELARAEQLAGQQAAYEKQQREVSHMRSFVDRFRYKASKARQAQSRLKALERLELIAPAHVDSPFTFAFREPQKLPRPLLAIDDASAGYDSRPVLNGVKLAIMPGDRLALLGANGAGKSTLIKLMADELAPCAGQIQRAKDLKIGYFAQHQLEQLRGDETPLAHLQRADGKARDQDLRSFLGSFNFHGEMVARPVGSFSGGEQARLVLAFLMYTRPNLLLLDEPTNHLDLDMRHALTVALQEFTGALVVVSHDRHLLRTTSDTLLLVHDGLVEPWTGDLDDYARWLAGGRRELNAKNASEREAVVVIDRAPRTTDRERRQLASQARERIRPLREAVRRAETQLERAHTEQTALVARLAAPNLYTPEERITLRDLLADKARLDRRVVDFEAEWLVQSTALEEAERAMNEARAER